MSAWLEELRRSATAEGQSATARRIGYSATVVCQVLKGTYKGDLNRVQSAVEGALMHATVDCPVIGDLPLQRCIEHQRGPRRFTNPMRVQLAHTCPTCPNRRSS